MPSNKLKINPFTVSVQEACQLIGISISTLYRHQPKDEAEAEKRAPTDYPIIKKRMVDHLYFMLIFRAGLKL